MSKKSIKSEATIYSAKNKYEDRNRDIVDAFTEFQITIKTLQSALLLILSDEDSILLDVLKRIDEFSLQDKECPRVLNNLNVGELLAQKNIFANHMDLFIRRFALKIVATIFENLGLMEIKEELLKAIYNIVCVRILFEEDYFCIEYMTVIIGVCFVDPKTANDVLENDELVSKLFSIISETHDPDILYTSYKILKQILNICLEPACLKLFQNEAFPLARILNDVTNEYLEIKLCALEILKVIIPTSGVLDQERNIFALQQLSKMLLDQSMHEHWTTIIDCFVAAIAVKNMSKIFFDENIFADVLKYLESIKSTKKKCQALRIFTETTKFTQYLEKLHFAGITQMFLDCISEEANAKHVILGLCRMLKNPWSSQVITDFNPLDKFLKIIQNSAAEMKTREDAASMICSLMEKATENTSKELMKSNFANIVTVIIGRDFFNVSVDFLLTNLHIIEKLAKIEEHRQSLATNGNFVKTFIEITLKNSFRSTVLLANVFNCFTPFISEKAVQTELLKNNLAKILTRALKSPANVVKSAVTNFIMLSVLSEEILKECIENGVFESLIMDQQSVYTCPTWSPAIESILSQSPTLKFHIWGVLSITDSTLHDSAFGDFHISKKHFKDFRILLELLINEVSPLHSVFVVNCNRALSDPETIVEVPIIPHCTDEAIRLDNDKDEYWCYCRKPGDENLPECVDKLRKILEIRGLEYQSKTQQCTNSIDFANMTNIVRIVAEIVANEMCGYDENATPQENCSDSAVSNHLHLLKCELHCNIIPLGAIRVGGHFERALLFKALSDEIGLPCSLVRGIDGNILFNEILLPIGDYEVTKSFQFAKPNNLYLNKSKESCKALRILPSRLVKPTHVVDLLDKIGECYLLDSPETLRYLRLL